MSKITDQLSSGVMSGGQLCKVLGVSRATLMRQLRGDRRTVVRFGRGPATRYGLRREIRGLESELPAYRIDTAGHPHPVGSLVVLAGNQTGWLPGGVIFDGLPPDVADMQPSGFMGRAFPHQHSDLRLPPRVTDWSDEHVLTALARRGEDLSGNLVLGDESMERWHSSPAIAVTRDEYPSLATAATHGNPPGSSAGGERPKFGAYSNGRHVLVKYAARSGGPVSERWRDLLILESLALTVLRDSGESAAEACLVESPTHTFLEIVRFDRVGARGRRAATTLAALDCDLSIPWARVASGLNASGLLSETDTRQLQLYDAFAQLIANTDRHPYNVMFFPEFTGKGATADIIPTRYSLAPAFDQLPMLYAPTPDGQLPERSFRHPTPRADTWDVWKRAESLAQKFWEQARTDRRLSEGMQEIATRHSSF